MRNHHIGNALLTPNCLAGESKLILFRVCGVLRGANPPRRTAGAADALAGDVQDASVPRVLRVGAPFV